MAWYPGAKKRELQPESDAQPAIRPTQLILHSIAAPWTEQRTYEYWRDSTKLESHFGQSFNGALGQYIGTQTRADANYSANRRSDGTGAVSVETASNLQHTDPWTTAQVAGLIDLGVWMHKTHSIPLRICRSWRDPGYGYHRLYREWSASGTDCPGSARVRQFNSEVFPGIVTKATGGTPPTPPKPQVDLSLLITASRVNPPAAGTPVTYTGVGLVETALYKEGLLSYGRIDGHFGSDTVSAYAKWQRRLGYTGSDADGIPGIASLTNLGGRHGFKVVM